VNKNNVNQTSGVGLCPSQAKNILKWKNNTLEKYKATQ